MNSQLKVYTDGGSRGNPGHSSAAWVVFKDNNVSEKGSEYLGIGTNNQAEYKAVILALKWILKNEKSNRIIFYLDSELVVRQLTGKYKIKDLKLKQLALEVRKLEKEIGVKLEFESVPREENKIADKLVNEKLDSVNS